MVEFGKKIVEHQHEPWKRYYLDYDALKKCIKRYKDAKKRKGSWKTPQQKQRKQQEDLLLTSDADNNKTTADDDTDNNKLALEGVVPVGGAVFATGDDDDGSSISDDDLEEDAFILKLEEEVEKVALFFLEEQGNIANMLSSLAQENIAILYPPPHTTSIGSFSSPRNLHHSNNNSSAFQAMYQKYYYVGVEFLHFIHYVDLNITAIRKILKKHDKVTGQHLSIAYRNRSNSDFPEDNHLKQLYHYQGISALYTSFSAAVMRIRELETSGRTSKSNLSHSQAQSRRSRINSAMDLVSEAMGLNMLNSPRLQRPLTSHDLTAVTTSEYGSATTTGESAAAGQLDWSRQIDMLLLYIATARNKLHTAVTLQDLLAAQMAENIGMGDFSDDDDQTIKIFDEANRPSALSNMLNLMSTFLYMTNYYIVAPTSGAYANKLGSSEALAGIIIGMTPIAALVSTVLYSWWTSYSYKNALIFASTCSVIGNILYGAALSFQSMEMVLLGRLLNGFGSARSINRRYIADSFPNDERTAASAAFVTAGALGMAAGPLIATGLHIGNPDPNSKYWTVENAPGWFMFVVWSIYLILLIIHFQDPPKVAAKKFPAIFEMIKRGINNGNDDDINNETKPLLIGNGVGENGNNLKDETPVNSIEVPGSTRQYVKSTSDITDNKVVGAGDNNDTNATGRNDDSSSLGSPSTNHSIPIYKAIPVATSFLIYFVLKLVLECMLSSAATLTGFYFDWDSSLIGIYLAILGLLVLPANMVVTYCSRRYDDRELIWGIQVFMIIGCVGVLNFTGISENYSLIQYLIFSTAMFISTNALEGPNMSLLSKIIPRSWRDGIFNVGLLATESGTLGRAIGDIIISACSFKGVEYLLNYCFGSMALASVVTFLISWIFYDYLEPDDRDD